MYEVNECLAVGHFCHASVTMIDIEIWETLTSLDLILLHTLPGHGIVPNDIRQSCRTEILLARLLFRTMFPGVLLHGLESVRPPTKLIMNLFEEFAGLLSNFQHPVGRQTKHFGDA